MTEDFAETGFPPNNRLMAVVFIENEKTLSIELDDGSTHKIPVDDVISIYGARIRRESVRLSTEKKGGSIMGKMALLSVGVPVNPLSGKSKNKTIKSEELQYVLGMRVKNKKELWYLMASSFNFRKSLGAGAAYSLDINLKAFIQKLGNFCPQVKKDQFFEAFLTKTALPEPVDSLMEFMKSTLTAS